MAVAIWRSTCLICSLIVLIVATRLSTSARRVASSSSPTRAAGARRSFGEQLRGLLAAGVVLPGQKPVQARFSQAARVGGAGVALKERERDPAVQVREQPERAGPEPLKLRAQLVAQRSSRPDEILSRPRQRPERLRLIAVGLEHPEAVMIGARQLAQHERIEPIRLPARDPEPIAGRRDLVGMQRQNPQPRVQQPLDQQPVGPLDRDQLNLEAHQRPAQGPQTLLVMRERRRQQPLARRVRDEHVVLL